jgi:hypothetical protein
MNSEQDLINRLMISKKIMEKHNTIGRGQAQDTISTPIVEDFKPVNGNYNIPQEFLQESEPQKKYNTEVPTEDRIMKSKLPDEIKQLMIQHPIQQSTMGVNSGVGLSEDLVERASRLMNTSQEPKQKNIVSENKQTSNINNEDIRGIIRETVEDVLRENGLIAESETKSNEVFKFRVGQHLFEGRVTNIKKIPKK